MLFIIIFGQKVLGNDTKINEPCLDGCEALTNGQV